MPDFSIIYQQQCPSAANGGPREFQLSTYNQRVNLQAPEQDHCGCLGFQYRGNCKHIREARETAERELCGWTEDDPEIAQTPQQEMEGICPKCGAETISVRVAV